MNWFVYRTRKKMTSLEMWFYHKSGAVIGIGTLFMRTC